MISENSRISYVIPRVLLYACVRVGGGINGGVRLIGSAVLLKAFDAVIAPSKDFFQSKSGLVQKKGL